MPVMQLKALNKHTRIMYIEMEMLSTTTKIKKISTRAFKHCARDAHTHTDTHTLYRLIEVKDSVAYLKYSEKRNVLS